ncbi:MAG: SH3 domain-containing protein [Sedimentisphaerales bacterium]|nr:SH3 domain-containing protein [Sedimentisphaerales bacterium]
MQSYTKVIAIFIAVFLFVNSAQGAISAAAAEADEASFPYIAEITENNVNIRSGPGTNYYHCGKLNSGDRVRVVASKYSWSHIVSPSGSFSWISKQYVNVEPNGRIGVVTGNSVRVYAGSELLKPIHSTTVQLMLNKGDKVELLGVEMDDYYKIVPPTGAYLWVLTQYTRPVGGVDKMEEAAAPTAKDEPQVEVKAKPKAKEPKAKAKAAMPAVVPTTMSVESDKLKEYYALANKIESERTKPVAEQNYTEIKKALAEIASDKGAGKAARYAEFAIQQIGRYELASAANQAVQFQDSQLQDTLERIENAHSKELARVPKLGRFAAMGQFQTSSIYGPEEGLRHYRITDDTGQTICYALPEGSASQIDLGKFVGRKVGLVGTIEPHPQTKGTLVRFTEVIEVK